MQELFEPFLQEDPVFSMICPDGIERRFVLCCFGIADSPEVCMQTSGRGGTGIVKGVVVPYPQCRKELRHSLLYETPSTATPSLPRTTASNSNVYKTASTANTVSDAESILKAASLNQPPSAWLQLPDVAVTHEDEPGTIEVPARDAASSTVSDVLLPVLAFGFQSLFPYEGLHNIYLGFIADMLKKAPGFALYATGEASTATAIINKASANHVFLSRNSIGEAMNRLATPGLSIAGSHANVTARELGSFARVFPFVLFGSTSVGYQRGRERSRRNENISAAPNAVHSCHSKALQLPRARKHSAVILGERLVFVATAVSTGSFPSASAVTWAADGINWRTKR